MNMASTRYKRQTVTVNPQPNIHSKQKGADRNGLHLQLYYPIDSHNSVSLEPTHDPAKCLKFRKALEGTI